MLCLKCAPSHYLFRWRCLWNATLIYHLYVYSICWINKDLINDGKGVLVDAKILFTQISCYIFQIKWALTGHTHKCPGWLLGIFHNFRVAKKSIEPTAVCMGSSGGVNKLFKKSSTLKSVGRQSQCNRRARFVTKRANWKCFWFQRRVGLVERSIENFNILTWYHFRVGASRLASIPRNWPLFPKRQSATIKLNNGYSLNKLAVASNHRWVRFVGRFSRKASCNFWLY